MRHSTSQTV
ncbi:hypothetical protein D049_4994A, partial [Vibrio parahaemolyticus VPTS-2010]